MSGNRNVAGRKPPETRRDNVREVMHGIEIEDPYHWLEDADGPETRAWIAAQNDYTCSFLDVLTVRDRVRGRIREMLLHALRAFSSGLDHEPQTAEDSSGFAQTLLALARTLDSHVERYGGEVLPSILRALSHQ